MIPHSRCRTEHHGIIPAYAGNTSSGQVLDLTYRDHPRVCGEHRMSMSAMTSMAGSSPRMRGTHRQACDIVLDEGIIPAYAGNTLAGEICFSPTKDHPRVCGEHRRARRHRRDPTGSSPRMRGTPTIFDSRSHKTRIIPAYAGNTER